MSDNFRKNSVLIVDDESANIITLTEILSPRYTVYASSEGQDAIEVAEKYLPDVVLLDVLMPEMDGYDVIAKLKRYEKTKNIPVIFITGLDNTTSEEKGLALGAADYIPKPFSSGIVKLRVQNQLQIVNHGRMLDERLRQQALITKISRGFLADAYVDSLYANTLRMVGEFLNTARVLLYKLEDDDSSLILVSEWIKPELSVKSGVGAKSRIDPALIASLNKSLADKEGDLDPRSKDSLLRDILNPREKYLNNYVTTPVFVKGKARAFLDFAREDNGQEWSESEKNLIDLIGGIFSGAFERDSMERQFSIVEHSPNLFFTITADACVEYVNPAVTSVTGFTKSELIANGLGAIFDKETLNEIIESHIPKAERGEIALFEVNITRKDGEKRILMISIVKTGKNNLGIITSDLTDIRELEAGLIKAKEQAEHLSRAKSEFLSRMSHEMRTPMSAIMGMSQIIKARGLPENLNDYFTKMDTASRNLLGIINDVLDVSGMEYGTFKLSDSDFNFNEMVKDVTREAIYNASIKKQSLTFNIDPAIPEILTGDEKRLKQVIANLLANAIKFTNELGEIHLEAHALPSKDASYGDNGIVTLRIEVADNGIGISEEQREKLFDIFEQGDGGLSRKYGGIGIGLALSKRIIEMMGGEIWLESELGKGSKFYVTCELRKK